MADYIFSNDIGDISLSDSVIAQLIVDKLSIIDEEIIITNSKGRRLNSPIKILGAELEDCVKISVTDEYLDIKVCTVIRFGLSIKKVTNKIIDAIETVIIDNLGINPNSISVIVTGVQSKNIAKRNIEVQRIYE